MTKAIIVMAALGAMMFGTVQATDSVSHFHGKQIDSIDDAMKTLETYNKRLQKSVSAENLSAADMSTVHELTYTLENALEKIEEALGNLADALEEVHQASEKADAEKVKEASTSYFELTETLFGKTAK